MTIDEARLLVRSLLGRFKKQGEGHTFPDGLVSDLEYQALSLLADVQDKKVGVWIPPVSPPPETTHLPRIALDLSSLQRNDAAGNLLLCLDFGTAMSKAWTWANDMRSAHPLILGKRAGDGDEPTLASSVFIQRDGTMLFGGAAERHFIEHNESEFVRPLRARKLR